MPCAYPAGELATRRLTMTLADSVTPARRLVTALAREMPYETAAAWVHAGALAWHATALGLVDEQPTIEATIQALADSHPALAGLADPAVCRIWSATPADTAPITALWAQHEVVDRSNPAETHDGGIAAGYRLGELYQALSVEAVKGRALCQTPRFVTSLMLHCTLPHVLDEWGLGEVRAVDPSCGTGHILVDLFLAVWREMGGPRDRRPFAADRIGRALAAVHGVDLDPYAAVLASYRLLAAACRLDGGAGQLRDAHRWMPRVVCADSLLATGVPLLARDRYHLAIGNPPYITVKDAATNEAIRAAYPRVCSGKYSLALPFCHLMTDLTVPGGWVAQLTANSFMKREFGKKFVEGYLSGLDLRWVIDTSGAYIPGHGTPTVILVHRNRPPASDKVHVVQGVRGEPSAPADPAQGLVWRAIDDAVRDVESRDRWKRGALAAAGRAAPTPTVAPVAPQSATYVQPSLFDLLDAA